MENKTSGGNDVFEISINDRVLNLEWYLHMVLEKWVNSLEIALLQGKDLETGLVNSAVCGDRAMGIATSLELIDFDNDPEFKKKLEAFEEKIKNLDISGSHKNTKISDFKVYAILNKIHHKSTKKGTVIV